MSAQPAYFNTTHLSGDELRAAIAAARKQEDAVLAIFRYRGCALSPWDVHAIGLDIGRKWLIGSVRRAMTNLSTYHGPLVQLESKKRGPQGACEHLWALDDQVSA